MLLRRLPNRVLPTGFIKRLIIAIVLLCGAAPAHADWFHTLVGLDCDNASDRLTIYFKGAYNEKGEAMIAQKGANEWLPGDFIVSMRDDDHIGEMTTATRVCKLSHGSLEIHIGPSPGNMNIQGECGAKISAWVEIKRDSKVVVPRQDFEPSCHEFDGQVLTSIAIDRADESPRLTFVTHSAFLGSQTSD
jgi:hypothetical protein